MRQGREDSQSKVIIIVQQVAAVAAPLGNSAEGLRVTPTPAREPGSCPPPPVSQQLGATPGGAKGILLGTSGLSELQPSR